MSAKSDNIKRRTLYSVLTFFFSDHADDDNGETSAHSENVCKTEKGKKGESVTRPKT